MISSLYYRYSTRLFLSSSSLFSLLLLLACTSFVKAVEEDCSKNYGAEADRITSLPGWDAPLPSAWYSGYLDYELEGQNIHTHYILLEAEELSDEDKKPLLYWSNGGPGASSLYGLFTELGPLLLSDESIKTDAYRETGIPSLIYNPYAWTRLGSILIFDQPAPVGFSYCTNSTSLDTTSNNNNCGLIGWTDELASTNVYLALQEFYKRHRCQKSKDLYLIGESYAGIYVPTFARRILEGEADINLRGIAVGDGCLGTQTGICGNLNAVGFGDFWNLLFMAGHHQIPLSDFQKVMKACGHHVDNKDFLLSGSVQDETCKAVLKRIKEELGGFYEYALYDTCTYENGLMLSGDKEFRGALNDYPCGGGMVLEQYVKLDAVHKALKVQSNFFETDNAGDGFDYTPTEPDVTPFYDDIIRNHKLRVLIYNGDTDPAITSFAAQNWTSHMDFVETQSWRPWTVDGCQRMGGYVTRYEKNTFDFLTIRGAGHMVPTYKPAATYTFLQSWIQNVDYPNFDNNCTSNMMMKSSQEKKKKNVSLNYDNSESKLLRKGKEKNSEAVLM
eukprot:CAMPEP_0194141190 /NCGR_PEP_ID=MMETSP0152-20130528/10651_1 /TAXON_ID=1049557 /ORGANISM="Thalassiothrix antarctica, Strain L6-D1" /LENGTH=558 /DNA_ID=CAMNT_0038839739 /DNA_START=42 /DNA_END=1715 /DNA_ORIENTATION=-